ncbi:MAG: hypothetical protein QXT28_12070 [Thermofilaceae archaeon]
MSSLALEDASSVLVRVGGVLLLILGIADIIKGFVMLVALSVLGSIAGGILSSIAPFFEFTKWVLPLLGSLVGGSSLVVGAVAAVVGYSLLKLPTPLSAEQVATHYRDTRSSRAGLPILLVPPRLRVNPPRLPTKLRLTSSQAGRDTSTFGITTLGNLSSLEQPGEPYPTAKRAAPARSSADSC